MNTNADKKILCRLVISLSESIPQLEEGFGCGSSSEGGGRIKFSVRMNVADFTLWLVGRAYGMASCSVWENWVHSFDPQRIGAWAQACDGDWFAIVFDRARSVVYVVSDRNGSSRVFYAMEGRRIAVATSIYDMVELIREPRVSPFGSFSLLTTYYTLDPYTLVEPARVTMPGQVVILSTDGVSSFQYYTSIQMEPSYYRDENECVHELDAVLRRSFIKRLSSERTPIVLLSGGIDSVAMVRYLTETSSRPVHTLTFSVRGQVKDEHEPARLAARHFGTRHHEVVIDRNRVTDLYRRAFKEHLTPNVSTLLALAVREYLESQGEHFDVYTGEDTRLHTPDFDLAKKIAIFLNLSEHGARSPAVQEWVARLLKTWSWYPRNYLKQLAELVRPYPSREDFILRCINKFTTPSNFDVGTSTAYQQLLNEMPKFSLAPDIQRVFKAHIALAYRLQYTDNMAETVAAFSGSRTELHLPFYDWDVVRVSERIPFHIGARGVWTVRSWSRFLMVNKRILRLVLSDTVPKSILYRRKATASAIDVLVRDRLSTMMIEILDRWLAPLLVDLGSDVGIVARHYTEAFCASEIDQRTVYAVLSICQLAVLGQMCRDPQFDLYREIDLVYQACILGSDETALAACA